MSDNTLSRAARIEGLHHDPTRRAFVRFGVTLGATFGFAGAAARLLGQRTPDGTAIGTEHSRTGGGANGMRILVTGSTDGLGRLAAESLMTAGPRVVVHARNEQRAATLRALVDRGADSVVGDFEDRDAVRRIAAQLNESKPLDSVIHNAGVYTGRAVMPVNIIAPYLLTALLRGPRRLVYVSSGMHLGGRPSLAGVDWRGRRAGSYEDSKLFVTTLAAAVARLRPHVRSNAVDPGWVPTRMGGAGAPDDLDLGHETQEWLATSDDAAALTSGGYWRHRERRQPHHAVHDVAFQDRLLKALAEETGVAIEDARS